jgi:hypothetical protein
MSQLTELLAQLQGGDPEVRDALFAAACTQDGRRCRSFA